MHRDFVIILDHSVDRRQREWNLGYLKSPMRKGSSGGPESVLDHEGWWRIHGVLFKSSTGHLTEFLPYNPARPKHNQWNLANALANMDGWSNSKMFHLVFRLPIHVHGPVGAQQGGSAQNDHTHNSGFSSCSGQFLCSNGVYWQGKCSLWCWNQCISHRYWELVHTYIWRIELKSLWNQGPWLNLLQIRVNMIQDQTYRLQITHLGTRIIQHQEISVFNHTAIVPLSECKWGL